MNKVLLESYDNDSKLSMYINFTDFIIEDKFVLSNKSFKEISLDIRNDSEDPVINEDYIFDRTDIRAIFITLYTLVFCCCFFGNLLVILVVTLSRRLRSITNFFLANLAVADLCVGVFCVFQNLSIYLISSWVLGDFLCKMYQFVHSLSYTASIFILVVICTERYFAIIHPITCKQILTSTRLRLVIAAVWVTSALYSAPKFIWVQTITVNITNSEPETICIPHRKKYDSELFDMINFLLLYVLPLLVMMILYTRIAVGLWRSSRQLERQFNAGVGNGQASSPFGTTNLQNTSQSNDPLHHPPSVQKYDKPNANLADTQVSVNDEGLPATSCAWRTRPGTSIQTQIPPLNTHPQIHHINSAPQSSQNVLRARRGVIRMLIVVVLTFALCNLPYHARKMWQYWSDDYRGNSNFSTLFTPLTFLVTYFNSGVNPLLYAFLSRNFRKGMRELLLCSFRNVKKNKTKQRFLGETRNQQPLSHSSILRIGSTRSMAKANHTCTTIIR